MKKTHYNLILVDGSSYLFRAFYALPPLTAPDGSPTGAIIGVLNMLKKLVASYTFDYIAVVFDSKQKTFRHEKYPEYKANRTEMPDELAAQIEPLHTLIKAEGFPLVLAQGVEADDVIGTYAVEASFKKLTTLISTGDKDLAQLVNENVTLINTMNDSVLTPEGVKNKFGVTPAQIIDYLSLIGDSSDNIPGVPGVGPKTALKWLTSYKTLDEVIAHADEIKGKVKDKLLNHIDDANLAKTLITIKLDVPVEISLSELKFKNRDLTLLKEKYTQFRFKKLLESVVNEQSKESAEKVKTAKKQNIKSDVKENTTEIENPTYKTILTENELAEYIKKVKQVKLFAIDLETTSLNYVEARIVGISLCIIANEAVYIPVAHDYEAAPKQLKLNKVLSVLKPILEDPSFKKIGHHIKYDMNVFVNENIYLQGVTYDTMLESYVYNSKATRHDLSSVALNYLQLNTISYQDVTGKGTKQINFSKVNIEEATKYAAEDADASFKVHEFLWPKLKLDSKLKKVFTQIEMPLVPVLSRMECIGIKLDTKMLQQQSIFLEKKLLTLEEKAYILAGTPFNLNSPKQLQEILFEKLDLPVQEKTPKGQPSTAESVLEVLALDYELPKVLLDYRQLFKLKSTYVDKLPEMISSKSGRLHTSYHQAVTATGRLSSTDPNLQNIPIRSDEGKKVREAFIAEAGNTIISADYSQIELRIMAHLSKDDGLLNAFKAGMDIHQATASEIFHKKITKVTVDERRHAKAVNFGLIYGMSAFGLAKQLGVERKEAETYIESYFNKFPKVKDYMQQARNFAEQNGFVETLFGRKLMLPEINSKNFRVRNQAARAAINAPMQGTAADIIKRAMILIDSWIQTKKVPVKMLLQVHDELIFEVEASFVNEACVQISNLMAQGADLDVPLVVDVGFGKNWQQAH